MKLEVYVTISEFGLDRVDCVSMGDATAGGVAIAETGRGPIHRLVSEDSSVYTNDKVL